MIGLDHFSPTSFQKLPALSQVDEILFYRELLEHYLFETHMYVQHMQLTPVPGHLYITFRNDEQDSVRQCITPNYPFKDVLNVFSNNLLSWFAQKGKQLKIQAAIMSTCATE